MKRRNEIMSEKTKQELVESFVNRPNLSNVEIIIKAKAIELDNKAAELRKELNQLNNLLQTKNSELLNVGGQLDGMIDLMAKLEVELINVSEAKV
jgi:putative NADH-flavin reductase